MAEPRGGPKVRGDDRVPAKENHGGGLKWTCAPTTVPPKGYQGIVRFFGARNGDKYWRFSNFALLPITIDGVEYITTEHYFQTMKFLPTSPEYAEQVRNTKTPFECKRLSKSRNHPIDPNWNERRIEIMRIALFTKALQHPEFREDLLSTGNAWIIEASPYDPFWGEGCTRQGKNMLGKLLVELRARLRPCTEEIYSN